MKPFAVFREGMNQHIEEMLKDTEYAYCVLLDHDKLYNTYLDSFPKGTNKIFRVRREFDCSCCRGFIKKLGHMVTIKDGVVTSIFDFETGDEAYDTVLKKLSEYVHSCCVEDVYLSKFKLIGLHHNMEWFVDDEATGKGHEHQWDHFYFQLPDRFVVTDGDKKGELVGKHHNTKDVFKNSLERISIDAIDTVMEMIEENTLYKGAEYKHTIKEFRKYKVKWEDVENKELFAWEYSVKAGEGIARIKNQAIGTLLMDLTNGRDLEEAVKAYEVITAPANYKRPKPIFTQKMLEDAQKKLTEMGFIDSLPRRFAKLDDITYNDILFCNRDSAKRVSGANDIFGELAKSAKTNKKNFDKCHEVTVDEFLNDVLPNSGKVELYLENKHIPSMVSLITSINEDSKSMFSWGNNKSWAYSGNITDSDITQRVIEAGGRTDGVLRFSHSWNYPGMRNGSLMDLHVFMPGSNQKPIYNAKGKEIHDNYGNDERVGWNHRTHHKSGGVQDVDYTAIAPINYIPVENTTFPSIDRLKEGIYTFKIHNWSLRQPTTGGFKAEIAFNGEVYKFTHKAPLAHKEWITLAKLELKNGKFNIIEMADTDNSSTEVWHLTTNNFVEVNAICFSPNYWENNLVKTGHKHLFFMLNGCINDERPSGIFNEFLVHELSENRKVMEAMSGKMRVEDSDDQLSGVGFALDKRNDVIVKVDGKPYKIKF